MIVLVIIMSLITTGKIQGQVPPLPEAVNVRITSSFPLDPRTLIPEQPRHLPQNIPRQSSLQRISTDRSVPSDNSDLIRPPTLESRPDRRLFIPERSPDRTRRPDITNNPVSTNIEKNNPVQYSVDMNQANRNDTTTSKPSITNEPNPVVPVSNRPSSDNTTVNGSKEMDGTTGKPTPPTVIDKATGVEVTLDERASFDGDKCPTGYVRIDGKCVEKD